jgi:NADH:ubiquinone oxidoreductase subunit 6 (subunit J)
MTLHIVLLAAIAILALMAILLTDLLRSAICLALASAALSVLFFQLGAPYAAVFELSVGAGLVMVLLVSAIGMTKRTPPENEEKGKSPVLIIPVLALLALAVIDIAIFVSLGSRILPAPGEQASSFSETLWRVRWLDVLAQLGIILVGVFAVLALFRKEGGLIGTTPRNESQPDPEEPHGP